MKQRIEKNGVRSLLKLSLNIVQDLGDSVEIIVAGGPSQNLQGDESANQKNWRLVAPLNLCLDTV